MMSLTFGLFIQVSDSGPQGPLILYITEVLCLIKFLYDYIISQGYGKTGKVGDRQFVLQVKGDGSKPVIDVIKIEDAWTKGRNRGVHGKITDRISYNRD